ncbi:MAG: DUF308 domain-containing protein, partial [Muribaculaceae bacterium]|nr:DUF308 domain-containing protein [Muribaculaceae bacterium]
AVCVCRREQAPWVGMVACRRCDRYVYRIVLVRSITLAEAVFPYFIAFVFIFWGISALVSAVNQRGRRYWWLYIINGILLLVIGFFFIDAGWGQDMEMTSFLVSLAFIYWGFSIAMASYDMKPTRVE